MVVNCCISTFIIRHKVITLIFIFMTIISVPSFLKVYHKLFTYEPGSNFFEEPIDVVYTWVNGSDPRFLQNLELYLQLNTTTTRDYSNQRFDDKYELKFSLRSLEKYASWIHHVYIVTNGQIPYWLNLDYDKVTLISHEEIFTDIAFDLPSFSSPAIESHLHRIPGLSRRFIYFNDDIFLGAPTFIDDFISPSHGFLIYLSWPLPMCAVDCPWVYVGDDQCDSACLNANCQMDGGDCATVPKIPNPWDENYYEALISARYNYSSRHKPKYASNQRNESKTKDDYYMNIVTKETVTNLHSIVYTGNVTNVTNLIQRHNENLILRNKLNRKKYNLRRIRKASAHFNSTKTTMRNNVDAYGASLQHTNRIFNLRYDFKSRYVPAHAPILIDKFIMGNLQTVFSKEFKITSRNRVRGVDDMQFAFSYYYFLINEITNLTIDEIFDRFDTDGSHTWSDREIRTILTKLYDLPLSYATVDHFEEILMNCSKRRDISSKFKAPDYERYIDSKLPTITRELVTQCPTLSNVLKDHFGLTRKYKFETVHNAQSSHVTFKMLSSNISEVVGHLDEIRRHTKKFVCLNDNLDVSKTGENDLIRAVLYDFYLSLFPNPSKFELPIDFRNRFLYVEDLNQWKYYHLKLKICTYTCILILCYITYCNLYKRRIFYRFINKIFC